MIEVVLCQTGLARHAPDLPNELASAGGAFSTVECFDRCDTCERFLLARIDGSTVRFRSGAELLTALAELRETP